MDGMVTVSGFTVIQVKVKEDKSVELNWWIKKASASHTITVTGIPVYAREECVRRVFSNCGTIESLTMRSTSEEKKQPSHLPQLHETIGYQQVDIKFKKEAGVKKALDMKYEDNHTLYDMEEKIIPMTDVWTKDLQTSYDIDIADLEERCTNFMKMYDKKKEKEEKTNRKLADEPDEDGWVTVTRNKFSRPPKAVKAHELKRLKKKKETAALLHFYKNQVNDSKMQRIRELKAKFEEDKKKIQQMKQQRKFKPY